MKSLFIRMTTAFLGLILPTVALGAPGEFRASQFRKGVRVHFLYDQKLDGPYSSTWWSTLIKTNGSWRDVYFETNEKLTSTGVLSFNCSDARANVGIIDYGNEFGNADKKVLFIIRPTEKRKWASESLPYNNSPSLPFEAYTAAFRRYCKR